MYGLWVVGQVRCQVGQLLRLHGGRAPLHELEPVASLFPAQANLAGIRIPDGMVGSGLRVETAVDVLGRLAQHAHLPDGFIGYSEPVAGFLCPEIRRGLQQAQLTRRTGIPDGRLAHAVICALEGIAFRGFRELPGVKTGRSHGPPHLTGIVLAPINCWAGRQAHDDVQPFLLLAIISRRTRTVKYLHAHIHAILLPGQGCMGTAVKCFGGIDACNFQPIFG